MQDACHMNFVIHLAHRGVSMAQWKSIGARNPLVWSSIPHGNSKCFLTNYSFFVPRLWQDEKNIFLYFFTELKTYHLPNFFSTNITPSTLPILAVFRTRVIWTSYLTSLTVASLWLSGRASERGIRWSEVRFLMGTQNVFLVPRSWQDQS